MCCPRYNGKSTIKIGPIIFPDGTFDYFHVPVGNLREPECDWISAIQFYEKTGFCFPNKEELNLIIKYKDIIDASDQSSQGKFSDIGNDWIWSSTKCGSDSAWSQRASDGTQYPSPESAKCWIVPFIRTNS